MQEEPQYRGIGNTVITRKTDGNPEGKGLNGLLADWQQSAPRGVVAKPHRQVLAELFTSMLVLSAEFKYRPVVNAANYLYWIDGQWLLSLIAPEEWSDQKRAAYVGMCVLQRDMTWAIDPSELLGQENAMSVAVGHFFDGFAETLDTDLTLEEILPFYVGRLSYYQRLYASALSRSVRATMTLGDQRATTCRQWYRLLPSEKSRLLSRGR